MQFRIKQNFIKIKQVVMYLYTRSLHQVKLPHSSQIYKKLNQSVSEINPNSFASFRLRITDPKIFTLDYNRNIKKVNYARVYCLAY